MLEDVVVASILATGVGAVPTLTSSQSISSSELDSSLKDLIEWVHGLLEPSCIGI